MANEFNNIADKILDVIKKSKRILLHCHPYPDPDSIGSVLAMTMVLKNMGVEVVPIMGDSDYPNNLKSLPHHDLLLKKNFSEINQNDFDLFIILDSSSLDQISRLGEVKISSNITTIVIDHHISNQKFGDFNLIDEKCSSTCQLLFDLFTRWNIKIDGDMAICMFLGIYADTGGFKYQNTTDKTLLVASKLANINHNFQKVIFEMENNKSPQEILYTGLALSSIEKYFSGKVAMASVTYSEIKKHGITKEYTQTGVANTLISAIGWDIGINFVETEPNEITVNLRTRNAEKYDVSLVAKSVGKGGGHKAAAGTTIYEPFEIAKKLLLDTLEKTFPNLNK